MVFGSSIEQLRNKSNNITDVFTKTMTSLQRVNEEINSEKQVRNEKIQVLTQEVSDLDSISQKNSKMIDKITKLFD
jgi:hypothetical protein